MYEEWIIEYLHHLIFAACLHVACVVQQKDARQWFAELSVDMEKVLSFYLLPFAMDWLAMLAMVKTCFACVGYWFELHSAIAL